MNNFIKSVGDLNICYVEQSKIQEDLFGKNYQIKIDGRAILTTNAEGIKDFADALSNFEPEND